MAISEKRLTLEEFLKLPEEKPALEFEDGVVAQKVSPKGQHGRLQFKFAQLIERLAEPDRRAMVFTELRSTYGGSSLVPDISVYRWDRLPRGPGGRVGDDFVTPPDIAIEIASPGQRQSALVRRCRWYVEHGVPIALLVEPRDDTVSRFRPGLREQMLRGSDRIDLDEVLPGFQLTVQELFDSLSLD
ncbi:MAG TPA: Uma2 family endonuclease [Chloroflexota bacterium]|nr:Uma2 family endonuclease [Chloroflexota bacterium]